MSWAPRFMWAWPSWLVEAISGLVTVGAVLAAIWVCQWWQGMVIVATLLSALYEKYVDGHGWDLDDVLQRQVGILLAVALWVALR